MRCEKIIYIVAVILVLSGVLLGKHFGVLEIRVAFCGLLMVVAIGFYRLLFNEF